MIAALRQLVAEHGTKVFSQQFVRAQGASAIRYAMRKNGCESGVMRT
jgi:hypothetical protein